MEHFSFDNSYARLPERFYSRLPPTPVESPSLIRVNVELATLLGVDVDTLSCREGVEVLSGNRVPMGSEPLAMAYAGHQFGGWVPRLGDGRAILLGEIVARDGIRRDIQLKGAGRTPFSRGGDGRAALGPILREYILSEAMHALRVPTTRSLAAVTTGEQVRREELLPGAILTRVARSHIRVGMFEYFASRGDFEAIRVLADHVIDRHYSKVRSDDHPYLSLLEAVLETQAQLVARWMHIGFIHGVMNTDNTAVAGETIDYGPCAFMDTYQAQTVFSSIDQMGRYAFINQPGIAQWNLMQLARCLLPILHEDENHALAEAQSLIDGFPERINAAILKGYCEKLGLSEYRKDDEELVQSLLNCMSENDADFTLTFRNLANLLDRNDDQEGQPRNLFKDPLAFDGWAARWLARLSDQSVSCGDHATRLRHVNPAFIPRNHLVEEVIRAAEDDGDFAPFNRLVDILAHPFDEQPSASRYALPPRPDQLVHQTFCGT